MAIMLCICVDGLLGYNVIHLRIVNIIIFIALLSRSCPYNFAMMPLNVSFHEFNVYLVALTHFVMDFHGGVFQFTTFK